MTLAFSRTINDTPQHGLFVTLRNFASALDMSPGIVRRILDALGGHVDAPVSRPAVPRVKTDFSVTVFSGDPESWVRYLTMPRTDRYDSDARIRILWDAERLKLAFDSECAFLQPLADCLNTTLQTLRAHLRKDAYAQSIFEDLVFGNQSNGCTPLYLVTSTKMPADATREVVFDASLQPSKTKLVLRRSDVQAVIQAWIARDADAPDMECLGIAWPVLFRVLGQLGFPSNPRDRFVEKIQVTSRLALLTLLVLYKAKRGERLVPNRAGRVYEQHVCRRDRVAPEQLNSRNAWFRILTEIGFMLDERLRIGQEDFVTATVRGYLDDRYLRLSLAGVMPDPPHWMTARPFHWKNDRPIVESKPKKGRYGVYDKEDLAAWKKVEGPFREMGFTILRQLGIGQFGRVYEAINRYNRSMPERIALKVDRIEKGKKKEAIQHADVTMQIARDLSATPHVIRIYDAGKLEGVKYTYHVLQLVDGDTLDNLAGIAGTEHASVQAPAEPRRSPAETRHEYMTAVAQSAGEAWRWRPNRRFADQISLAQVLDLLTSILLWLEETHERGYAINDLKNGNLMMSRRGQLKGIDLDSYARIVSPLDRMTDFYFLGISILLLFVNLPRADGAPKLIGEHVLRETGSLRLAFEDAWSFGDVRVLSDGRVENEDVIALAVKLIQRCRDRTYVDDAGSFSEDINWLRRLKHSIFLDEIVVD